MKFIAKTLYGLENVVADELATLGAADITVANRAVMFTGELPLLYTVNYKSGCALSFLMEIASFRIRSAEDLYNATSKIAWERYMSSDQTFSIVPVVKSEIFSHTGYAALKAKDAIVDRFRKREGKRPSVSTGNPDILINLHISHGSVTVSLDSSGDPLYKRGYRSENVAAPLNEVLASGMIRLSGWKPGESLVDPMCGSGTISIEAGLIACNIAPGSFRKSFGFQRWKDYDRRLFDLVREKLDKQVNMPASLKIECSDISIDAVKAAEINIGNAGLGALITPVVSDLADLNPSGKEGYLIINPPYGERLSQGETNELYAMIGSKLKHSFEGYTAWIISSNRESLKFIGLKSSAKHILFNGALECRFERFEMYPGSRRKPLS